MRHVLLELEQTARMHESNAKTCQRFGDPDGEEMAKSRAGEYRAAIAALNEHLRRQADAAAADKLGSQQCACEGAKAT